MYTMARIEVKAVSEDLKKEFFAYCKENQVSASYLIREYMKKVVRDNDNTVTITGKKILNSLK